MTDAEGSRERPSSEALSVTADLDVEIDGVFSHLAGDGRRLVLHSEHPQSTWSALTQASLPDSIGDVRGPRAIGRVARAMADAGVHLDVEGPRGVVVSLGDGERSVIGRVVTGSTAVRPRSARSLLPFVGVAARRIARRRK
ncbi:hypothetical protein [Allobranchiibius sp. CTAmp26]|uniref:hypothetical protein n=1 Tax=Allobranchiibius sp. CTAmp26 TaxID=2815214 RepID=UPI001AA143DA|nr:hypothetical protein [Allobranchiibius sp. CTAmp26]MBO1753886.1 hypothetical protein [Allobranchiibius sp. CTAmp26]